MTSIERQINLLPRKEFGEESKKRRSRIAYMILFALFVTASLVALGVWFIAILLSRNIAGHEQQVRNLQETIASFSAKEQKVQLLVNRLKSAASILSTRSAFETELDQVVSILPEEVSLVSADMQQGAKVVTFNIQSHTYSGFRDAMLALKNAGFSRVEVKQLSRNHTGTYAVQVAVTLR